MDDTGPRIPGGATGALPVLTPDGMRAWERATWASGVREADVIARVGARVAAFARKRAGDGRILLLAGKGHNGDDVRAAMPHLGHGQAVHLDILDPEASMAALERALAQRPALVVDGLFGIGLNRPLSGAWVRWVNKVNASGAQVAAVDVPSGCNALDGTPWGAVMRADETWTVGCPKTGLLTSAAVPWVGRVRVLDDVGLVPWMSAAIPDEDVAGHWGDDGWAWAWAMRRSVDLHKGRMGHVGVVAGSRGYHGAAVLATRGALAANPGLVTTWTHPRSYVPVAAQVASAMVMEWEQGLPMGQGVTCLVAGPGLAGPGVEPWLVRWVREAWAESDAAMVVDASALDMLEPGPVKPGRIRVITPHPGEAARLLGGTADAVQRDRVGALQRLEAMFEGAWVVLKGHGTLVGRQGWKPWWNATGNPWLAQGGSGDVLAGYLGGWLARPGPGPDPGSVLRAAVAEHGAAADRLLEAGMGWTTEDLAGEIGRRSRSTPL